MSAKGVDERMINVHYYYYHRKHKAENIGVAAMAGPVWKPAFRSFRS